MELIIFREGREVGRHRLSEGTFSLGRGLHNTIALEDQSISRRHARIRVEDGRVVAQDLCSANGTWLRGRRFAEADLRDGDVLEIGPFYIHVHFFGDYVIRHDDERTETRIRLYNHDREHSGVAALEFSPRGYSAPDALDKTVVGLRVRPPAELEADAKPAGAATFESGAPAAKRETSTETTGPEAASTTTAPEADSTTTAPEPASTATAPEAASGVSVSEPASTTTAPEAATGASVSESASMTTAPEAASGMSVSEPASTTTAPEAASTPSVSETASMTTAPEAASGISVSETTSTTTAPEAASTPSVSESASTTTAPDAASTPAVEASAVPAQDAGTSVETPAEALPSPPVGSPASDTLTAASSETDGQDPPRSEPTFSDESLASKATDLLADGSDAGESDPGGTLPEFGAVADIMGADDAAHPEEEPDSGPDWMEPHDLFGLHDDDSWLHQEGEKPGARTSSAVAPASSPVAVSNSTGGLQAGAHLDRDADATLEPAAGYQTAEGHATPGSSPGLGSESTAVQAVAMLQSDEVPGFRDLPPLDVREDDAELEEITPGRSGSRETPRLPNTLNLADSDPLGQADGLRRLLFNPMGEAPPAEEIPARLTLRAGRASHEQFELSRGTSFIGRAEEMEVVLLDTNASRRHAAISWEEDAYTLRDLWSLNGVIVNGQRVSAARLHHGDRIQIGDTVLEFTWLAEAAPDMEESMTLVKHRAALEASVPTPEPPPVVKPAAAASTPDRRAAPAPGVLAAASTPDRRAAPAPGMLAAAMVGFLVLAGGSVWLMRDRPDPASDVSDGPSQNLVASAGAPSAEQDSALSAGADAPRASQASASGGAPGAAQAGGPVSGSGNVVSGASVDPGAAAAGAAPPAVTATAVASAPPPPAPATAPATPATSSSARSGTTAASRSATAQPSPPATSTGSAARTTSPAPARPGASTATSASAVAPSRPSGATSASPTTTTTSSPGATTTPASGATTASRTAASTPPASSAVAASETRTSSPSSAPPPTASVAAKPTSEPAKPTAVALAPAPKQDRAAATTDLPRARNDLERRVQREYQAGLAAVKQGRHLEAVRAFERALAEDANRETELYYEIQDQIDAARSRLHEQARPLVYTAVTLTEQGKLVEARQKLVEAVNLAPDYQPATSRLRQIEQKLAQQANQLFSSAREKEQAGSADEAEQLYRQVLSLIPDPSNPVHQRAEARLEKLKQGR